MQTTLPTLSTLPHPMRRRLVYIATWMIYASLYLTRKPFSVVKPLLIEQESLDRSSLANIDTAFLVAYAFAQLIIGPIGDRIGSRSALSVSLVAAATVTLLFACSKPLLLPLAALWFVNGASQSAAFPLCQKALFPFFGQSERGAALVGTLYSFALR
jgi:MFS transporter, OPA family, glycerol-3-phosphate transporter